MYKVRLNTLLAAGIAVTSGANAPAFAQNTNVDSLEEITVIGSHIRGIEAGGPSPLLTFDMDSIKFTGVATLQQFFEKLPQNFGGGANGANVGNLGVDRDTGNNFGQGSTINLRGLGTGTTLTLINGHRVASTNRYQYVDVSLIPLSAVERVEILTDGASAIYGADAVGGVVNIVLKRDFTGYETALRHGTVTDGGLNEYQASQTAGWSWNDGRALVSYEFLQQDNLSAMDKDFSRNVMDTPYDLYPGSKRHSVYADGFQQISDVLALDLSGSFAKRDMDTTIASSTDETRLFPRTQQYDLFAGLTLDLPQQWQVRFNAGYGKSEVRYERTTITATSINTAAPTDMDSSVGYLDLIADGEMFTLAAGEVRAAVGASYRHDGYDFFDHRGSERPFNPGRDVTSAFAELNIPLLKDRPGVRNLSLTAAARYDNYSDFGSTTNPKVGFLWETTEELSFRASYGRSYRAPVFQDLQANNTVSVLSVPHPDAPGGSTITMQIFNGNPGLGPERAKTWTSGFSLAPQAIPGLKVQANYYHIDYSDRIDRGYPGSILNLFSQSTDPYAPILTFNPTLQEIEQASQLGLSGLQFLIVRAGPFAVPADKNEKNTQVILDNRVRNNAFTSQQGIDLDASYSVDAGESRIVLSLAGQYIIDSTRRVTSAASEADALNLVYLPVDLKIRGGAALTRRNLAGGVFVNYVDSYRDPSNSADPRVDSWLTIDLNLEYGFAPATGSQPGTRLALNVQNLFDRDPPFIINARGTGYDPTNATPLGRFASVTLTHRW